VAYRSSGNGYVDVANHYREKIENGVLGPGDALPAVDEIRGQFEISAKTVSRALKVLKDEGFVAHRGALGTVVTERPLVAPTSGAARVDRTRKGGPNYSAGETSTGHMAQIRACADPGICRELGIEPHEEVLIRKRVFRVHGVPRVIGIEVIHLRALATVSDLDKQGPRGPVHWFTQYEETTGKPISGSPEMRGARHAARDELEDLEVSLPDADVAVPVLVTRTTWHDEDGPIEVMEDIYAPGIWHAAKA
jgi:GntR family transcriptional regulator